jgi:hypothetical protein
MLAGRRFGLLRGHRDGTTANGREKATWIRAPPDVEVDSNRATFTLTIQSSSLQTADDSRQDPIASLLDCNLHMLVPW